MKCNPVYLFMFSVALCIKKLLSHPCKQSLVLATFIFRNSSIDSPKALFICRGFDLFPPQVDYLYLLPRVIASVIGMVIY